MVNKKDITYNQLTTIKPVTDSQKNVFESWKKDKNQFLFGCAGTGKTFISLYLALKQVLNPETPFDRVIVVRSLIPTREIGFLPGDEEDKAALYQVPYSNMMQFMFEQPTSTHLMSTMTVPSQSNCTRARFSRLQETRTWL